jgi:choline-sulfatase
MSRRDFATIVAAGMGARWLPDRGLADSAQNSVRRPNILFICSDQHSGQMLTGASPHSDVPVHTPNLSRLAAMGVSFRNAYCCSPVCVPARASMMTGRFASDVGSYGNATPFDGGVPTWGNYLQGAGYSCWATGKMDLTSEKDLGFTQVNTQHGHFHRPDITELFRRPMCYRVDERQLVDGQVRERATPDKERLDAGLAFVRAQPATARKPWAAFIGVVTPHPPFEAPEKYWKLYPPDRIRLPDVPPGHLERLHPVFQVLRDFSMISTPIPEERMRRARTAYYGMISELDEHLGTMIDDFQRTGTLNHTVVIYTADHGEMLGEHGLWLKRTLLEGAARVPMIVAGGGLPAGRVIDTPVSHLDLVATVLDLAAAERPRDLRGTSLLPLIAGSPDAGPRYVYGECHTEGNCTGSFMIRKGDWKYIHFSYYNKNLLFNLRDDPGEMHDLASAAQTASIEHELHATLTSIVDPAVVTTRAFEKQEEVLTGLIRDNNPDDFFQILEGRLGQGQAAVLTQKHYPRWHPAA